MKGTGNSVDFGARIYDPRLGRWLACDPLQAKYSDLSPYSFTANNPIYFVDPDGKRVIVKDIKAFKAVLNTLSAEEVDRVIIDKNGEILIVGIEKGGDNFNSLSKMINSDRVYNVAVSDNYNNKNGSSKLSETHNTGVTLFSDPKSKDEEASPDNENYIYIKPSTEKEEAKTAAHELYGHGLFNELEKEGQNVNRSHTYEEQTEVQGEGWQTTFKTKIVDTNQPLKEQINKTENEAGVNYEKNQNSDAIKSKLEEY